MAWKPNCSTRLAKKGLEGSLFDGFGWGGRPEDCFKQIFTGDQNSGLDWELWSAPEPPGKSPLNPPLLDLKPNGSTRLA